MAPMAAGAETTLSRQALAALGAAVGEHLAAADSRHASAKAMAALADQLRGLVGALQRRISDFGAAATSAAEADPA